MHAASLPLPRTAPATRSAGLAIATATVVSTVFVALDHGGGGTTPAEILAGIARLAALKAWVPKPLGKRDDDLRTLLYVGFAQIEMGLPAHAAVDATVEVTRAMGRTHQAGMVNAVLRRALREGFPAIEPEAAWPAWSYWPLCRLWC